MRNKEVVSYQQERDYIDDCLRHVGSKQHLFYETHICTIFRVNAGPAEHFSETRALYLLQKYRRKRQSHCTGSLLEDRISFERNKASGKIPFRPWVTYKEIKELYINRATPHFFVLCIDSMYSSMRYYEIYKCKIPETAQTVCEYLRRAMNDTDKVLRDLTSIRQVYVDDVGRVRSVSNFEVENNRATISIPENNQNYYTHNNISPVYLPSPVMVSPVKQSYSPSLNASAKRRTIDSLHDVTYLTYDPHKGIITNRYGPVYLYLYRPKSQGTLGNNSIYSDRRSSYSYGNEDHHRNSPYRY
ncbi:hypothetical protein MS3_00004289 [Schistosoma haematobium]|uniref:Trematode PH-like domain-containing protein n=2 Tax=Schistosoma TaxID=6181 RepID=A0A094ZK04_SCHHA|nr:hypothetical protein MS3_00004289 [Schistosoma haematobium]CAH8648833.1 unnamed protein product [Schistosoma intercalatum]CAH8665807.1 unnamed protein product [Schistosoma curassoni]KAH9592325.1 hypothetical protein MS3_00004289 [Schistosoma haematobium]CAH8650768.1 unnamed protein product [Schistosoma intercalatum]CAH8676813.1 unnamed protein product [Schistosoma haematobium]